MDTEQLQFIEDFKRQARKDLAARIALHTYAVQLSQDRRLADKAKEIFDWLEETKGSVSLAMGLQMAERIERPPTPDVDPEEPA